jgi:glycolate oxidase iron-sulfur subunit
VRAKTSGLKHLIRMMKILEDRVQRCTRCGMCQAVCPVYAATGHEKDVARGKLLLLDGLMREMFQNPDGVAESLDHCLLCGACEAGCPRQVSVLEIFLTARSTISVYRGLSPFKKILFRRIMAHPKLFNRLASWSIRFQHLVVRPTGIRAGSSCSRLASPIFSNRQIVPMAPVPFHKMDIHIPKFPPPAGPRVLFFVGCLLDKFFPDTAKTIMEVLAYHGARVIIPKDQGCCGIPMLSSGDQESFNRLVDYHLGRFNTEKFDYLVTGCATCTATIKKIWPSMAETQSQQRTESLASLAEKTYDISQFLVNIIGVSHPRDTLNPDASKSRATYHDPCHLHNTLKVYKEPRILIHASSKYELTEMPDATACCGMGGSFNLKHYGTSMEIGLKKIEKIKASGASIVATGCPACMIQLNDMMAKTNTAVDVKHVVDLYADGLFPKTQQGQ